MSSPPPPETDDANPEPAGASSSPFVPLPAPAAPRPDAAPAGQPPGEFGVLLRATLALFVIGFAVWLIFAWSDYRKHYALATENLHRGAQNFIELTLIREDRANLSCASNATVGGLHCAFGADEQPRPPADDDRHVLRPYNTTGGELFLGAGLWSSPALQGGLPAQRFTVFCDYDIAGALRSVALRWAPDGKFGAVGKSLTVGLLHDCAIPE